MCAAPAPNLNAKTRRRRAADTSCIASGTQGLQPPAPRVLRDDGGGPQEEADAERRAQAAAPGQVLLDRHHGAERQHPADAAGADHEHHEHDRPAAADAEDAVIDAEPERVPARALPAPMLVDETERGAAFVEAMVLERAELEGAGDAEHDRTDDPDIEGEQRA